MTEECGRYVLIGGEGCSFNPVPLPLITAKQGILLKHLFVGVSVFVCVPMCVCVSVSLRVYVSACLRLCVSPSLSLLRIPSPGLKGKQMVVGQHQWYYFGVRAPPILVYFSGD